MEPDRFCRPRDSSIYFRLAMDSAQPAQTGDSPIILVGGPALVSRHASVPAGQHLRNPNAAPAVVGLEHARAWRLAWCGVALWFRLGCILPVLSVSMGEFHVGLSNLLCASGVVRHGFMDW